MVKIKVIFLMMVCFLNSYGTSSIKKEEEMLSMLSVLETKVFKLKRELKELGLKALEIKSSNLNTEEGISVLKINDEVLEDETLKLKRNIEDVRNYYSLKNYVNKE